MDGESSAGFTACGKTQIFVIPRRAARRGISLFLHLNRREIPRFARNDKIKYFFRCLFSLRGFGLIEPKIRRLKPALLKPAT